MTKSNLHTAGAVSLWSVPVRVAARQPRVAVPAPSLRLPATRENRVRLRELREAELAAWQTGSPGAALRAEVQNSLVGQRRESWLFAGVAVIAALALMLGAASSMDFVRNWNAFVGLVRTLLG